MQRVLLGLLALLSCALAAPVAPATAAAPLKPVAKAKGGGRSDMMKGLAATLSPDNKKAFKALVAEKKLAKGEAAIRAPAANAARATRHSPRLRRTTWRPHSHHRTHSFRHQRAAPTRRHRRAATGDEKKTEAVEAKIKTLLGASYASFVAAKAAKKGGAKAVGAAPKRRRLLKA